MPCLFLMQILKLLQMKLLFCPPNQTYSLLIVKLYFSHRFLKVLSSICLQLNQNLFCSLCHIPKEIQLHLCNKHLLSLDNVLNLQYPKFMLLLLFANILLIFLMNLITLYSLDLKLRQLYFR